MTTPIDISPEAVDKISFTLDDCSRLMMPSIRGSTCGEIAATLRALRNELTASESQRQLAVDALLEIAAMGKKAGSEHAKNTLINMGLNWDTGEPGPNYGSMT